MEYVSRLLPGAVGDYVTRGLSPGSILHPHDDQDACRDVFPYSSNYNH